MTRTRSFGSAAHHRKCKVGAALSRFDQDLTGPRLGINSALGRHGISTIASMTEGIELPRAYCGVVLAEQRVAPPALVPQTSRFPWAFSCSCRGSSSLTLAAPLDALAV
jgi:hypothetical protein